MNKHDVLERFYGCMSAVAMPPCTVLQSFIALVYPIFPDNLQGLELFQNSLWNPRVCIYRYINLNKLSIFPDVFSINTCDFPAKYATCGRIKQFFYLPPQSGAKTASIQTSGRKDLGLDHLIPKEESCAYV